MAANQASRSQINIKELNVDDFVTDGEVKRQSYFERESLEDKDKIKENEEQRLNSLDSILSKEDNNVLDNPSDMIQGSQSYGITNIVTTNNSKDRSTSKLSKKGSKLAKSRRGTLVKQSTFD